MKAECRPTYVYTLVDPHSGVVRYVGRTVNPRSRLSSHVGCCWGENKRKTAWIKRLRARGLAPAMVIVRRCSIFRAAELEAEWILKHRRTVFNSRRRDLTEVRLVDLGDMRFYR